MSMKREVPVMARQTDTTEQTQRPLVSVIIPCYNQAQYLPDAIESALEQTYKNVEIIVVDDGSTDGAAAIAGRFSSVRYIRQENRGLSAARNTGLQISRGKYIVFLDSDDRLLPGAISAGIECFRHYPDCGFVFGGYRKVYSDGASSATERDLRVAGDYYLQLLHGNFIGMHATVMYSREVLKRAGNFDTEVNATADYEMYLRIARRFKVQKHGSVVAEYRKHDGNMSADGFLMLRSVLRVLNMERAHISDRRQMRAVRSGIKFYKRYYGNDLIDAWKKQKNFLGFLALMRWYPGGLLRRTANSLLNRISFRSEMRKVNFGSLRCLSPFSRQFGFDRSKPVDRVYVESFLNSFAADIRGRVLEIGDDHYSRTYGGNRITGQDVLHISAGHPGATIIADLVDAPQIPTERFDCVVFTQTLQFIYDFKSALATLHRILKPGGVLLATVPGISQICRDASYPEADSWRFTACSASKLFTEFFAEDDVRVQMYGNVLTATAFLYGIPAHELKPAELDYPDADYPGIIGIRARKEEVGP
jgi:glycosyltransferase involved in cell wall biosynthesis